MKFFFDPEHHELPPDTRTLFDKIQPFNNGKLIRKNPYSNLDTVAYLWKDEELPEDNSEISHIWYTTHSELKKAEVYSYHTYGGYYGFFRPSLDEVIKASEKYIRNADICYITTETCDSSGVTTYTGSNYYNAYRDKHRGKPTLLLYNRK